MSEPAVFYYHFKRLNYWLILNIFITCLFICCAVKYSYCLYLSEFYTMLFSILLSWGLWGYKHLIKQKLAVITDEYIKIDHCKPLYWQYVTSAEEKIVTCWFLKFKVIILNTQKDMPYNYNFLQKHNGNFTPFSLPLYSVITPSDAETIKENIKKKTTYIELQEK